MSDMDQEAWDRLIQGLRDGDQATCSDFWNQFGPTLEVIAKKQLSDRLQRRVGPDDVVQSACRTFFRRMSVGQFEVEDADALWRLMCALTLTKARRAARDHSRQKRGFQNEVYLDSAGAANDHESPSMDLPGSGESPLSAVAFADELDLLLKNLSPQECQVLDLKLQNHTNDEIAEQLKCSERTVRRLSTQIRTRWTQLFDTEPE